VRYGCAPVTPVRSLGLGLAPLSLIAALLAAGACSSDPDGRNTGTTDASTTLDSGTTTGTVADAGRDDAGDDGDASTTPDAGTTGADASTRDGATSDASSGPDGSTSSSQACMDLLGCCATAPANLQMTCESVGQAGDDARCTQVLDLAMSLGACGGTPADAGPAVDAGPFDAGPIGPACTAYLDCCPELGGLAGRCQMTVAAADEAQCARALGLAQQLGRCLGDGGVPTFDAALPDVGLPDLGLPDPDAALPDLGLELPDAELPDAELPDAELPDLGLEVDAGDLDAGAAPDA
jgi:hypothetical protein